MNNRILPDKFYDDRTVRDTVNRVYYFLLVFDFVFAFCISVLMIFMYPYDHIPQILKHLFADSVLTSFFLESIAMFLSRKSIRIDDCICFLATRVF